MKKTIFITGGHVTPAIALIDELKKHDDIVVVYIGRTYAVEYSLITEKGVRFLPIFAGKSSIASWGKIPIGFIQALWYVVRENPRLIVSFGGYVALPIAFAGWLRNIPILTHEQTRNPGRANRMISRLATRVCVTFEETRGMFPAKKTVVTGLPIRKELFAKGTPPPFAVDIAAHPLIYVTGGSQGAESLNAIVLSCIPELTRTYTVIHQTGKRAIQSTNKRYITMPFVPASMLSWVMHNAHLVIGRSGANTTLELAALGCVSLLIPLPWAAGNEQLLQAEWLAKHGGAVVLQQNEVTQQTLIDTIHRMMQSISTYKDRARSFMPHVPRDGSARVASEIISLLA